MCSSRKRTHNRRQDAETPTPNLPLRNNLSPKCTRQPFRTKRRSRDADTWRAAIFFVKVTFVMLLCGSSFLAGSFFGQDLDSNASVEDYGPAKNELTQVKQELEQIRKRTLQEKGIVEKIPHIIWQTYKTKLLPEGMPQDIQDSWRKLNPDWEVRLLDDADVDEYVASEYPYYLPSFRSLPLAVMRIDVWRLLVVAREGGAYADADVECKKPIEKWLPDECQVVLGLDWHYEDYFANFFLAAVPGHPLMRDVVDYIINNTNNTLVNMTNPDVVHETAGPAALTEAVLYHMGLDNVRVRGSDGQGSKQRAVNLTALMGDGIPDYGKLMRNPRLGMARLRNGVCLAGKLFITDLLLTNHGGSQHPDYLKAGWTDWRKERRIASHTEEEVNKHVASQGGGESIDSRGDDDSRGGQKRDHIASRESERILPQGGAYDWLRKDIARHKAVD